jgi:ABC transporter substrate binding protein
MTSMNRRAFVSGAVSMLTVPKTIEAQQPRKVYRLGLMGIGGPEWKDHRITQAFRAGLIANLALRAGLPSMFGQSEMAKAGGLIEYAPSSVDNYRRAATFVDKILKGAKPADLPVEQPTKFELVINLKTAKALGLTIPPSLLLRADQVIDSGRRRRRDGGGDLTVRDIRRHAISLRASARACAAAEPGQGGGGPARRWASS